MKTIRAITATTLCVICLFSVSLAQTQTQTQAQQQQMQPPGRFGLGFVFGEPTGISWKYRMDQVNAVDGAIGFSPFDRVRFHVDYLWQAHPFNEPRLGLYYGPGITFGEGYYFPEDQAGFGVRGEIGMNYLVRQTPLELFFEMAPTIILTPGSTSGLDVGFGGRFSL